MDPPRLRVSLAAAAVLALSCCAAQPAAATAGVASVNAVTLSEADLQLRLRPDHQRANSEPPPDFRKQVLETMIAEELLAQRAHELGLDSDPEYLAGLVPLQAQLDGYKRKALSELMIAHELKEKGAVTDAEARQFFDDHAAKLRTQVQISQILRRSAESIEQARHELAEAPSFEAYARSQFPQLALTERPWELGYLRWEQLPPAWREVVYGLKKGEVSPVIHAEKDRYWILQVTDVRELPGVTFESIRPTLVEALKGNKLAQLREKTATELRAKATIVYPRP